jgi:glycosyltransferase involved in cell wall biosynthesis
LKRLLGVSSKKRRRGNAAAGSPKTTAGQEIGPIRMLSMAPPVFFSGIHRDEYLGIAPAFGRRYGKQKAGFMIFPTWTLERPGVPAAIKHRFDDHVARHPEHRLRFVCNTPEETKSLEELGLPAMFLNKNVMVSDRIFRPIQGAHVEFDAVYTARFVPVKRHELAAAVPRVGYVTYLQGGEPWTGHFRTLHAAAVARNPNHMLLNDMVDGLPTYMSHQQVNAALNRAAVGLVLSEVEGSNYASVEYLLAGLPVVSTPSKGGRDVFFDPEYCIVCEPTPAAVRDAVAALRARNVPRELVRARTLAKIEAERKRFLAMIDDLIEELGGERQNSDAWPFGDTSGATWLPFAKHLAVFAERQRAALAQELELEPEALANVQLEAGELRPIVTAIRELPRCALLVFGCGNDSPFWESVNRGGTTAFLEDDPEWAGKACAKLVTAPVHSVQYGTTLAEWRRLLDSPVELAMDLPAEVTSRQWDVIVVDAPSGYNGTQPGRMKSIYAASKLVAPGGRVFVHDCQRPAEQAFTSRYLGDDRLFIEVKGRTILRGYAF